LSKGRPAGRRTQGERTAQTRAALIDAARRLFGAEGFAEVSAERIAREASMTRGALYHQFTDKADLFAAVLDQVEAEIAQRVAGAVAGFDPADTTGMLLAGAGAGIDRGSLPPQPVQALTHVLVGAVDEAALYIAQADDEAAARTDMDLVLHRLTLALTTPA